MVVEKKKTVPIEDMVTLSKKKEFVVLDIETTGLSPNKGGFIIEIAAIRIVDSKIVEEFSYLIDPKQKLYGKTIELTGITNEMVVGQPTYGEILPKLYNFMGDAVIVAHNAMFDWDRFLLFYFSKLGYYPRNEVICTKRFFQNMRPDRRKLKLGYGLTQLCEEYKVEFDESEHHRALVDTKVTAEAFLKMREDYFQATGTSENTVETTEDTPAPDVKKVKTIKVTNVRYWEKKLKTRELKRIYVQFNHQEQYFGTAYYDIPTGCWFIKEFDLPIDIEAVEKAVLSKIAKESMADYLMAIGA